MKCTFNYSRTRMHKVAILSLLVTIR